MTHTDLQAFSMQNGPNGQVGVVSRAPAASDVESLQPALLAGQPLVYVPSTSLFMLYGRLQEQLSPGSRATSERDSRSSEVTAAEQSSTPSVQKRLSEERKPQEEEPATKRQSRVYEDGPLSLVIPKVTELRWSCSVTPLTQSFFLVKTQILGLEYEVFHVSLV